MVMTIGERTAQIRENNIAKGWRAAEGGPGDNTLGDYIALLITETGEATDAYRDWQLADGTALYDCPPQGCHGMADCSAGHETLNKPEGVGSELADIVIRLLDTGDVFGFTVFEPDFELGDVAELFPALSDPDLPRLVTFADHMAWVARRVVAIWTDQSAAPYALRAVVTVARKYGIDLEAEVERKMKYNATRTFQHGGRTLSGTGA
jgi:NTP pyrophosphatase (non-canonical NTP hydrolase)